MKAQRYKEYLKGAILCIGCGSLVGAVIFFFKLLAHELEHISKEIYEKAENNVLIAVLVFAFLILCAVLMCFIHKKVPEVKGGGIPRSEGVVRGILTFRWLPTMIFTAVGSMMSFFCGVPLGSEGPSVLIGTSLGNMCGKMTKNMGSWSRYIMTGGAGAGFAAATGAPFSAVLFVLEEMQKRFTPLLILIASTSVLSATFVNYALCSLFNMSTALFDIGAVGFKIELVHTWYFILLGLIISIGVGIFDFAVAKYGILIGKLGKQIPAFSMLILAFIITGVLGIVASDTIYSGHGIVVSVVQNNKTISFLILVLIIRVGMMLLTTSGKVTGGIFVPSLAIGALIGALAGKFLCLIGMPAELYGTVVLMSMCAFMGGTARAPMTATVFFLESTAEFTNLFYIVLVVFIVNFATELFNTKPFYDRVLEDMEHEQNNGSKREIIRFEMKVSKGAFVIGKSVRDILWPHSSIVVSIIGANNRHREMDSDGEKKLYEGDTLIMQAEVIDMKETLSYLQSLVGREYEITYKTA